MPIIGGRLSNHPIPYCDKCGMTAFIEMSDEEKERAGYRRPEPTPLDEMVRVVGMEEEKELQEKHQSYEIGWEDVARWMVIAIATAAVGAMMYACTLVK